MGKEQQMVGPQNKILNLSDHIVPNNWKVVYPCSGILLSKVLRKKVSTDSQSNLCNSQKHYTEQNKVGMKDGIIPFK